jgi:phospholipase C
MKTAKRSARRLLLVGLFIATETACFEIEHVVVLVFENRPFDQLYGFAQRELPGINGLRGDEFNYYDARHPAKGRVGVKRGGAPYVWCDTEPGVRATAFRRLRAGAQSAH